MTSKRRLEDLLVVGVRFQWLTNGDCSFSIGLVGVLHREVQIHCFGPEPKSTLQSQEPHRYESTAKAIAVEMLVKLAGPPTSPEKMQSELFSCP